MQRVRGPMRHRWDGWGVGGGRQWGCCFVQQGGGVGRLAGRSGLQGTEGGGDWLRGACVAWGKGSGAQGTGTGVQTGERKWGEHTGHRKWGGRGEVTSWEVLQWQTRGRHPGAASVAVRILASSHARQKGMF